MNQLSASGYAKQHNKSTQRICALLVKITNLKQEPEKNKSKMEKYMNRHFKNVESFEKVGATWIIKLKQS